MKTKHGRSPAASRMWPWIVAPVVLTIAGLVLSVAVRMSLTNVGLGEICSYEQLEALEISATTALGQMGAEGAVCHDMEENQQQYVEAARIAPVVLAVHSTGVLAQEGTMLMQEVQVIRVIRTPDGENVPRAGETVRLFRNGGFIKAGSRMKYGDTKNLMNPDHTYLVFLSPSALNANQHTKEYNFVGNTPFGCININREESYILPTAQTLWQLKEQNTFCSSEAVWQAYRGVEDEIYRMFEMDLQDAK